MTPEEHEKYIDQLERNANEAMDSWDREQRVGKMLWWLFVTAIATGVLCYFL